MAGYHFNQLPRPVPWMKDAACRDTDPNLFFPVGTTGPAIEQIETAKAVCRECSVQSDCLEYALETKQEYGIWGGASEDELRQLRRARARDIGRTATK